MHALRLGAQGCQKNAGVCKRDNHIDMTLD